MMADSKVEEDMMADFVRGREEVSPSCVDTVAQGVWVYFNLTAVP
jgi:hypothetical protein